MKLTFKCIVPNPHMAMIQGGECPFCDDKKGGPCTWYLNIRINPSDRSGYITCDNPVCHELMEIYMRTLRSRVHESAIWQEKVLPAFAGNKPITVKRSSGALETNWRITKDRYGGNCSDGGLGDDNADEKVKLILRYNYEKEDMDALIICSKPDDNDFTKDSIQKAIEINEIFMYE